MLEFRNVTKRFVRSHGLGDLLLRRHSRYVTAVNSVNFRCEPGEIVGLVGPNGAGKTTLSKLAVNLILPDSGEIFIAGRVANSKDHELRRQISLVTADDRGFFTRLSGLDNLKFFLSLYGLNDMKPVLELAEYFELTPRLKHPFGTYSTGMRKKLALVRAFMTNPRIILLDEATNGLDPASVIQVKNLMLEQCDNKSVLWATHRLEEVRDLCNRVLVLRSGSVLFDGRPAECGFDTGSGSPASALDEAYLSLMGR
jgi:ABC-2 type transport system ATP-binding protein